MEKAIYFDMDGTVADLYGVDNWLPKLRNEDVSPYVEAEPMFKMSELEEIMNSFIALGFVIGVISWASMNSSKEYQKEVRKAKKNWVAENMPYVTEFHVVKYGYPKHYTRKVKDSILIDDNAEVRAAWKGQTVDASDPEKTLIYLRELLDTYRKAC